MEEIKEELKLFLKHKNKFLKFIDQRTYTTKESELFNGNYSVKENIIRFLKPFSVGNNFKNEGIKIIEEDKKNKDLVIYVNGICSTIEMANYQKKWLEKIMRKPITLAYNYTDGFLLDIYECMLDRTYKGKEKISIASFNLKEYIKKHIKNYESIEVIGFSQGALITGRALEELSKEIKKEELKKIKHVSFANPSVSLNLPNEIYAEHFINKNDLIANVGIVNHKSKIKGRKYYQNKEGHLLVADYLIPLCLNYFNKKSLFYKKYITLEVQEKIKKNLSEEYFNLHRRKK